jgi:hypothetical protein
MGLMHAKRNGTVLGRPAIKKLSASEVVAIRKARSEGSTLRAISMRFGIPISCAYRACSGVLKHSFKNKAKHTKRRPVNTGK